MTRRSFLTGSLAAAGTLAVQPRGFAGSGGRQEWLCFSRVFRSFGIDKAAELIARAGYSGLELTVRDGGFVEPSHAIAEMPKAIATVKRQGLSCDNIIVRFLDPYEGKNLDLLKCAADNGVRVFRPELFRYGFNEPAAQALDRIRRGFDRLDRAARETGLRMLYQNHSTYNKAIPIFGSLGWDLWEVVRNYDPRHVGVQYDLMHARAEQGPSWQRALSLLGPWIGTLCLKDFRFAMDERCPGDWKRELLPPGEGGICDWTHFKAICVREGIVAPYTVHFDYEFPEHDAEAAFRCAKRDLEWFQCHLR